MVNKKQIDGQDLCECGHKEFHHIYMNEKETPCSMSGCECIKFIKSKDGIK